MDPTLKPPLVIYFGKEPQKYFAIKIILYHFVRKVNDQSTPQPPQYPLKSAPKAFSRDLLEGSFVI